MRQWKDRIEHNYRCAKCGGHVKKMNCAPIVKGSVLTMECIRCGASGSRKWKLGRAKNGDGLTNVRGDIEKIEE